MSKKQQTYKKGVIVFFKLKDISPEEIAEGTEVPSKLYKALDGCPVKIKGLKTYTELGDKDYEYYNIQVKEGGLNLKITGVSGYHLDREEDDKKKELTLEDKCPKLFDIANVFDEKGLGEVVGKFTHDYIQEAIQEMENHSKELSDYGVDVPKLGSALDKLNVLEELDNLDELLNLFP